MFGNAKVGGKSCHRVFESLERDEERVGDIDAQRSPRKDVAMSLSLVDEEFL